MNRPPVRGPSSATADPSVLSPEGTRDQLLHVARELFATHGFEGTSIRDITGRADANLGAVTYHFGTKRKLYEAVLASVFGPLRERVARVAAHRKGSTLERIEQAVRTFFEHLSENPDQPRFMFQELSSAPPPAEMVTGTVERVLGTMIEMIREGQDAGEIREGEPRLLALSVLSQPIYLTLVHQAMAHFEMAPQPGPQARNAIVEHAVEFIRRGLAPEEVS